jgi:hypothetical protein
MVMKLVTPKDGVLLEELTVSKLIKNNQSFTAAEDS